MSNQSYGFALVHASGRARSWHPNMKQAMDAAFTLLVDEGHAFAIRPASEAIWPAREVSN